MSDAGKAWKGPERVEGRGEREEGSGGRERRKKGREERRKRIGEGSEQKGEKEGRGVSPHVNIYRALL